MRTTIELKDEHRARLLELSARRGEKGFSCLVNEAVEIYLRSQEGRVARQRKSLELRGALSEEAADELCERVAKIRAEWR